MKEFTTENIRNFCLAGQRGCGKTSFADAVAFNTGQNNRIGRVDDGSSLMDYTESEISKNTSISSKLLAAEWNKNKINLFDCPGHSDFIGELLSSMTVAESVGILISAPSGVEVGTNIQWKWIDKFKCSRFFFVNKIEVENANWRNCLEQIKESFGKQAVAVQIPMGEADSFKGIVDLLHMKAYEFDASGNRKEIEIPADLKEDAEAEREALIEVAAEADDALLEKFFEEGTLSDADTIIGLKKGIKEGVIYPILFGSATKNMGIKVVLDFIIEYLPSPVDRSPVKAVKTDTEDIVDVKIDSNGKVLTYFFKTVSEGHLGDMSYFKAYSGTVKSGSDFKNQQTNNSERATQIYTFHGKNREEVSSVPAGDIGVLVKLKGTLAGHSLADSSLGLSIPKTEYPNPVMDVAIKSKSKGDEDKIGTGLNKLMTEDPTFKFVLDPALKQQILYTQGSTQIEVIQEKLKTRFGVEVELEKPKIPYRETIKGKAEKQYRHKKQSGGRGQFGDVHLRIEPNTRGGGFEFDDKIKGGVIPSKYIPAVEKGVVESMQHGGLAGAPVVDVKVAVFFGSYHDVDSSDMAFKIAASGAFKEGFLECKPILLEPIFDVEITVPDDFTGDVMGDISSRRGKIGGMDPDGRNQTIRAQVPQAELYQYSVDLRSMTQGQGVYSLAFSHYEEVPHDAAKKVMEEAKRAKEEEKE
ncbi:MAG: elongation factor G [candidate division Zixibacteria bacterium]|nr:elongation factor G [candidate division Zixibacteria bacterium]